MTNFKLNTNPKLKSGFKVPDDYFAEFNNNLLDQLPKEEPKIISFYHHNKKWFYSIAAILVIGIMIPFIYQAQDNEHIINPVELESYLISDTSIIDDDIINLLDQEDIDKLIIKTPIEKESIEDILSTNAEVEYYITN